MNFPARGLYAITQTENKSDAQIIADVTSAIKGGACVVQYRDKQAKSAQRAASVLQLCHDYRVPLILNDDIDLALEISADGVHLGRDDASLTEARRRLGPDAIIGASCYNDLEKALEMQHQSASYVAFGRFFPSQSKPLASPAELHTLHKAKLSLNIPIVAIGGILPENGGQLLEAGADVLAVIGGIFDHAPEHSAQRYLALFN